jgi:protein kinase A
VEEGQVEAVIQERDIMKKMFHPFIVDFVASFQDEKFLYMVVDLIQGGELFSRIHDTESNGSGLDENQARFYALCVADALAYLHRLGYVFRGKGSQMNSPSNFFSSFSHIQSFVKDLKPENVMLDAEGYPKLIDFGFAKVRELLV